MRWFRLYTDALDDDKLRLLAFEDRWHYVATLCLKSSGLLDEPPGVLRERRIAVKLGLTVRECEEVKRRLSEVGLISDDWQPIGWNRRQYKADDSTQRVRKYRQRKRAETLQEREVTVTVTSTETESEAEAESESEAESKDVARDARRQNRRVASLSPPNNIGSVSWSEWVAYRRACRKPISDTAAQKQWALLALLDFEQQAECIAHSIRNDYQGLFPEKFAIGGDRPDRSAAGRIAANATRERASLRSRTFDQDLTDRSWAETETRVATYVGDRPDRSAAGRVRANVERELAEIDAQGKSKNADRFG